MSRRLAGRPLGRNLLVACLTLALAACGAMSADRGADRTQHIADTARTLTPEGLARLRRGMAEGATSLAARFDPAAHTDFWGRPRGWTSLSLATPPAFPFGQLNAADAAQLNAALPIDDADFAPAQPFFLRASGAERERAVLCMTQAIYYEAALEPTEGQQAVAQTVLNRVRHPDFPKSICGVVYEGSQLPIGCQFSFTCDGSLARPPIEPYWTRAKTVAEAALDGFVAADIGSATHYHADYVFPRWGPTLVKIGQIGAHIFYRFPGPAGLPGALRQSYRGEELRVAMAGPRPAITLVNTITTAGQNYFYIEPRAAQPLRRPTPGTVLFGRRFPTRDEIDKINAALLEMEKKSATLAAASARGPEPTS